MVKSVQIILLMFFFGGLTYLGQQGDGSEQAEVNAADKIAVVVILIAGLTLHRICPTFRFLVNSVVAVLVGMALLDRLNNDE